MDRVIFHTSKKAGNKPFFVRVESAWKIGLKGMEGNKGGLLKSVPDTRQESYANILPPEG